MWQSRRRAAQLLQQEASARAHRGVRPLRLTAGVAGLRRRRPRRPARRVGRDGHGRRRRGRRPACAGRRLQAVACRARAARVGTLLACECHGMATCSAQATAPVPKLSVLKLPGQQAPQPARPCPAGQCVQPASTARPPQPCASERGAHSAQRPPRAPGRPVYPPPPCRAPMPPGWSKNDAAACSCCCGAACNAGAHIDGPAAPARAHGQQPHAQHSTTAEASNKAQIGEWPFLRSPPQTPRHHNP